MEQAFVVEDLAGLIDAIKPDSIISRTFFKDDHIKSILFGFDAGQELSEHTAAQSVIIQIVQGEALVTLGDARHELKAGAWIHLAPNLKHSIYAQTPLLMHLLMLGY